MRYDYIKTLIQENLQETDEDEYEEDKKKNINEKKCMKIIERIKFLFDFLRKIHDRSVNNLAVSIDNFFHKRKIDIRADIKLLKENIKENEEINIQRNKEIKDTLEELKFQIKGYSAKKERMKSIEAEKIEGKKLIFDDDIQQNEDKKDMEINKEEKIIENKNIENEEKKVEEKIEVKENKEEKIIGKKRLRKEKSQNENEEINQNDKE